MPHIVLALCNAIINMFLMLHHHSRALHKLPYHHLVRELRRVIDRLVYRISGHQL